MSAASEHRISNISEMAEIPAVTIRYSEDIAPESLGIHRNTFYVIACYLGGTVEKYIVGDRSYQLRPGDLLILPPDVPHRLGASEGEGHFRRYELVIPAERIGEEDGCCMSRILKTCQENGLYRIRRTSPQENYGLEDYLEVMWREFNASQPCKPDYRESLCLHFMIQLNRIIAYEHMSARSRSSSDYLLDMVLGYIQRNFDRTLSLKALADRFYTSTSNIEMLFRKRLRCPFYRYVTECRIIHAQKLIGVGVPMKEVCAACGYNDYSNFYRAFTKVTGITPTKYRQRLYPDLPPRKAR